MSAKNSDVRGLEEKLKAGNVLASQLTPKYLLRKGFDIGCSTIENRRSVNWRKEK